MIVHTVASTSETVRSGDLDPSAPPVATIDSGDVVSYPNTWTHWGNEATCIVAAGLAARVHTPPPPDLALTDLAT
jgi:hypothetical protein